MRRTIARLLRRIAQRLAPVPTAAQLEELRDYYDNHCTVTGERINQQAPGRGVTTYTINVGNYGQSVGEMQRRAYQDATTQLAKLSRF
jgi:hypothetical protein